MRRMLAAAAIGTLMVSTAVAGENTLSPGSRIRLMTVAPEPADGGRGYRIHGRLLHEDDDSLTMAVPGEEPVARTKPHRWLVGRLVAMDDRSLVIQPAGDQDPVRLSTQEITALEVSSGRPRGRRALEGAAIGGLGGAVLGFATTGGDSQQWFSPGESALILGVTGTAVGALFGALSGGEDWRPAGGRVRVTLVPDSSLGLSARLAIRF